MQENKRSKTVSPEIKITKKKNAGGIEEPSLSTVITCHLLDVSFSDQIAGFFPPKPHVYNSKTHH